MFLPSSFHLPQKVLVYLFLLTVYFSYEITCIEITFPERKENSSSVFFVYFIVSVKKESR